MTASICHKVVGTALEIYRDNNDQPGSVYDFEKIGFSKNVAKALVRAFVALQGSNSLESQRAYWIQVKRFGNFARATFGRPERLPANCLDKFNEWMALQGLGIRSIGSTYNSIVRILKWCFRNIPDVVDPKIRMDRLPYASQAKRSLAHTEQVPDEALVRQILSACYSEIEEIERRIFDIRLLSISSEASELVNLLKLLLHHGGGVFPNQAQLLKVPGSKAILARLRSHGGLMGISGQYYLSMRDVFPFYLAILTQTSGNPQSLLYAEQDCIVGVPMRMDLERVVWDKARAGREQAPDFPKDKEWAAPNIVRRIKLLNEELRPLASPKSTNRLFLCRSQHSHVTAPCWQTIHNCFRDFRKRHDLPKFDLRSLRFAGAKLHHRAARSLAAAKQRLQHASDITTQTYTPLDDIRDVHDRAILRFQGLLLSESQKFALNTISADELYSSMASAETLFGFGCKDPLGGIASGSRKGETCLHFHQCATCSGAMIVVDDPACVARLIRSSDHLVQERDRAMKEGWSRRFEMLYAPTLAILQRDILPSISIRTIDQARENPLPPLPPLE